MTELYIPTTEEIKREATRLGGWRPEVFDDWLASHDAEVRAKTLEDAAAEIVRWRDGSPRAVANMRRAAMWLRARAAREADHA